jgi:hypothetical protein
VSLVNTACWGPSSREPLHSIPVTVVLKHFGLDILGPLPLTSADNKLVIIIFFDYFTKWVEAFVTVTDSIRSLTVIMIILLFCFS